MIWNWTNIYHDDPVFLHFLKKNTGTGLMSGRQRVDIVTQNYIFIRFRSKLCCCSCHCVHCTPNNITGGLKLQFETVQRDADMSSDAQRVQMRRKMMMNGRRQQLVAHCAFCRKLPRGWVTADWLLSHIEIVLINLAISSQYSYPGKYTPT